MAISNTPTPPASEKCTECGGYGNVESVRGGTEPCPKGCLVPALTIEEIRNHPVLWYTRTSDVVTTLLAALGTTPAPDTSTDDGEFLLGLAQNDYMIDQHLLPTGERLVQIANKLRPAKGLSPG